MIRKERRNYRKGRHKASSRNGGVQSGMNNVSSTAAATVASSSHFSDVPSASSEEEVEGTVAISQSDVDDAESDREKQGPFAFRRKLHCEYLAVSPAIILLLMYSFYCPVFFLFAFAYFF